MRLNQGTDYALRILLYLGLTGERLVTIDEIAASYAISRDHVMKMVHRLGVLGFIETTRGRGGGIRLARDPEDIGVGEVVRAIEPGFHLVECLRPGQSECRIEGGCQLKGILQEACAAFLEVLDRYTLQDLLSSRRRLRTLLGTATPHTAA
jgi:Rrf2 family nitric oxide-sensitive transcriptional repressor